VNAAERQKKVNRMVHAEIKALTNSGVLKTFITGNQQGNLLKRRTFNESNWAPVREMVDSTPGLMAVKNIAKARVQRTLWER